MKIEFILKNNNSSVVPKSGLIPFNPQKEPFKSYSTRLKHFLTDAGVRRATEFHNSGKIPKMFKWLILAETGYLDPTIESESEEETETTMLTEEEIVEDQDQEEDQDQDQDQDKDKMSSTISKKPKIIKELIVKNKRGRKPKNQNSSEMIASPKPMNPANVMKIEALISSKMSSESISKEALATEI